MPFSINIHAQVDLEGGENVPVRITGNPQPTFFGGAQQPPYLQMATFLNNAFNTPDDGEMFIRDSSVCSNGVPNTNDFEPFLRATYQYEEGRLHVIEFYRINESGTRIPFSRKQFTYEGDNLKQYLYLRWNQGSSEWKPESRERFLYNENAGIEMVISENWNGTDWLLNERSLYQYNADGRIESLTNAIWTGDMWVGTERIHTEYNENHLPSVIRYQEKNGDSWITTAKETAGYDEDFGFIQESYLLEVADEKSGELESSLREQYTYNLRGFYSERTRQVWNDTTETWENALKDLFSYSPIGVWTRWDQQIWDDKWKPALIREFKFNNGSQVDAEQAWISEIGDWVNTRRRLVQYDDFGNLVRERNRELWNPVTSEWVNGPEAKQCRHFWSQEATTYIRDVEKNKMVCRFMNPYQAGSEINCISEELDGRFYAEVYDLAGRLLYQQPFLNGETFSIQQKLKMGMYNLVIKNQNRLVYRRKMIIHE